MRTNEETGGQIKLHHDEPHHLNSSPDNLAWEEEKLTQILVREPGEKRTIRISKGRSEDITMNS